MQRFVGSTLDRGVAADVEHLARRYLDGRAALSRRARRTAR